MENKEIIPLFSKYLFIEDRFTCDNWDLKIFHAKKNLIKYLYSTWMCVGWSYTKEMHQFIKEL